MPATQPDIPPAQLPVKHVPQPNPKSPLSISRSISVLFARGLAYLVLLVAISVLVGWQLEILVLRRVSPGWADMTPLTAVCFALGATAVLTFRRSHRVSLLTAAVSLIIAALTLVEYALALDLGFSQLLFNEQLKNSTAGGRMSLATAIGLLLVSSALLLRQQRRLGRISNLLAGIAGMLSLLSLTGYLLGVESLYSVTPFSSMALHTSLLMMCLALAVPASQPSVGFFRVFLSQGAGGTAARWLLPLVVPLQFVLAWVALAGYQRGYYGVPFAMSIVALFASMVSILAVRMVAGLLYKVDLERSAAIKELQKSAVTDHLTGLHNRRGFTLLARQGLSAAHRARESRCLLFIDLDGLKQINDQQGHEAGDALLQEAAKVLRGSFRESDIVARLGGDEFAVLTTDDSDCEEIVRRLQGCVDLHNKQSHHKPQVAFSVGAVLSEISERHPQLDALLAEADSRMYANKQQRKAARLQN